MFNFNDFYRNINLPVIVCLDDDKKTVVYENANACLMFNPLSKGQDWRHVDGDTFVADVLKMPEEDLQKLRELLLQKGSITDFSTQVQTYSGEKMTVEFSANFLELDGQRYMQIALNTVQNGRLSLSTAQALETAFNIAFKSKTTDEAINNILEFAGNYTKVSRSYIFEATSEVTTANTYEWCAEGVEPSIDQLQDLPKDEYSYDDIIQSGLAVTDDIRTLSEEDRAILEPQGIKALAIIPILSPNGPLGYVGFDDCEKYRTWSEGEVLLLQDLASLLGSLLIRRDAERSLRYSLEILSTVTENFDNIVYVSDIHSKKILFANKAFAKSAGYTNNDELVGKSCNEVMVLFAKNACEFCPLNKMLDDEGKIIRSDYIWEMHNETDGKWYLVRDAIIKWIDGRNVHLQTMTEITDQKEYEAQLEYVASTDMMTGIYNREHGLQLIQNILDNKVREQVNSIVFIDLDGLKKTNDQYGHTAGDEMILKTVEIIRSCIRKSDLLCRWGGDEFVMVIRANEEQTEKVVQKIKKRLAEENETGGRPYSLSFSYGIIGIQPQTERALDDLIAEADQKMYENKMESRR